MVAGLKKFREYFAEYSDNYIIIGGTACDIIIEQAGFTARTTKDIDLILVVEALNSEFIKQFWKFIEDGEYEKKEKSADERKYYRFMNPGKTDFPQQIELFSRNPDLIDLEEGSHLTPIPVDDDFTSLSAILLDDDYYRYIVEHSILEEGLIRAKIEALIVLKAKAFLDISERISKGIKEDNRKLHKHKGDIFRLGAMLAENDVFDLPENIKKDLQKFIELITLTLPGNEIYKEMGLKAISAENVLKQIVKSFRLKELMIFEK